MNTHDPIIAFEGDAYLGNWGESGTHGKWVKLILREPEGAPPEGTPHPFTTARTSSGKKMGQRYAVVLVEIGEDEQPVRKTHAQMAFLLCKDPAFWYFLNERSFVTVDSEESARACILEGCKATSRSAFDKDPAARAAWLTLFYNPFDIYRTALNEKAFT